MKKVILFITALFFIFLTYAQQVINFDKEIRVNTNRLPRGTRYVDRWGYPWINTAQNNSLIRSAVNLISCSSFNLIFADFDNHNGRGFDDQNFVPLPNNHPLGVASIKLGELRRWTACQVFTYISQVISIPNSTSPPDIVFDVSEFDGTGALGSGSPFFSALAPVNSFQGGLLQEHITTGIDPTPDAGDYDARIILDFGLNNSWSINGQNIQFNSGEYSTDGHGLDLYSIILHEATHALGFFSNIQSNGNCFLTNSQTGKYSLLDKYLFSAYFPNTPNVNTGPSLINLNTYSFQGNISSLTSNVIKYFNVNNNSKSFSIYSPPIWQSGSSLSHFDNFREPQENYMMTPSYAGGTKRFFSKAELSVFCNFGYNIISTLTDFNCSDRYAVGVDDFATINLSGNVTQNVISNDYDFDGEQIALDIPSVILLSSAGTLTTSGNNITFTSNGTYTGDVIIKYRPYTPANGHKGSFAFFKINVISPDYCPLDPCNYICNGSFEEGLNITQFDAIAHASIQAGNYKTVTYGGIPGWKDLGNQYSSADCFFRNSMEFSFGQSYPAFGVPTNYFSQVLPGIETPTTPGNSRYAGFAGGFESEGVSASEGIYRQLVKPLIAGENYLLTYSARAIKLVSILNGTIPAILNTSFSNSAPPIDGVNSPVFNGDNMTHSNIQFTTSNSPTNDWTNVSIPFQASNSSNFIIIQPEIVPYTNTNYYFIDNVRLIKVGNQISVSTTPSLTNPKIGDNVTFTINVCNTGTTALNNVSLTNVIPVGTSLVSSTLNAFPNHNFTTLAAGQCVTLFVTTNVEPGVAFNTNLNNCANITTTNACAQTQSCATIRVLATDINVATSQSATCNKFSVTVSNSGVVDAHNVKLSYIPPSCFGYSSYSVISGIATYSTNQITVPSIAAGTSVIIEFTGNTTTAGCINTISVLGSYDEWDLISSNNSSSINVIACPQNNGIWPKAYYSQDGSGTLMKANNGNIIWNPSLIWNSPSNAFYNHIGYFPPSSQVYISSLQYTSSGITNWAKTDDSWSLFSFNNGTVLMSNGSITYCINSTTGNSTICPYSSLQNNESLIAETSDGKLITLSNSTFRLHTLSGSVINTSNNSCQIGQFGGGNFIFNKNTNKLFSFGNSANPCFNIYTYSGSSLNLTYSTLIPSSVFSNYSNIFFDDNDNCYFIQNGFLFRYNYYTNNISTVNNITGFSNNNLYLANYYTGTDNYTSNKYVLLNTSNNYLYVLDFGSLSSRKLLTSNLVEGFQSVIDGDNVYLTGGCPSPIYIGNQVIPQMGWVPIFITKLSIANDFVTSKTSNDSKINESLNLFGRNSNDDKENIKINKEINTPNVKAIEIYNLLGQLLSNITDQQSINDLLIKKAPSTKYSPGLYFLKIIYKNNSIETIKRFLN